MTGRALKDENGARPRDPGRVWVFPTDVAEGHRGARGQIVPLAAIIARPSGADEEQAQTLPAQRISASHAGRPVFGGYRCGVMDLLVVGGSGLLGREVTRQASRAGARVGATFHRQAAAIPGVDWRALDIRRRDDVTALVGQIRPATIINAAFRQTDWATTADGAMHVAAAAAAAGARLVHVSSDVVFSGLASPYDETCRPDPTTPYGAAKAAAETAVTGLDPAAVIARTSLIIGNGTSLHETYVRALASGAADGVLFTDDVRCPIHVADLAAALLELAASPYAGIQHVAGPDAVTRHELGVLIARRDGLDDTKLRTGRRAVIGPPAPLDVRLDCTVTQSRLTTRLRGAHEFLAPIA